MVLSKIKVNKSYFWQDRGGCALAVTEISNSHGLAYLKGCCEQVQASSVAVVPISSVVVSATPRSGGEDAGHVRTLAEVLADLPPIVVHR